MGKVDKEILIREVNTNKIKALVIKVQINTTSKEVVDINKTTKHNNSHLLKLMAVVLHQWTNSSSSGVDSHHKEELQQVEINLINNQEAVDNGTRVQANRIINNKILTSSNNINHNHMEHLQHPISSIQIALIWDITIIKHKIRIRILFQHIYQEHSQWAQLDGKIHPKMLKEERFLSVDFHVVLMRRSSTTTSLNLEQLKTTFWWDTNKQVNQKDLDLLYTKISLL